MINELINEYKQKGKDKFDQLSHENFKHGLNIKIEPDNFSFDNIKFELEKDQNLNEEDIDKLKLFFQEEFSKDNSKTDFFNQMNVNKITFLDLEKINDEVIYLDNEINENTISYILIYSSEEIKKNIFIKNKGNPNYFSQEIRLIAKKDSKINLFTINNLSKDTIYFDNKKILQKEDSIVKINDVCLGSSFSRYKSNSYLLEKGSNFFQRGLYLSNESQKVDMSYNAYHIANETNSDLITKGALKGNSQGLSRSLISIGEDAFDSEGYESQDALIIDEGVSANAIPQLEIKNPNVKCSHGSTIGRVNKDEVFYLMSRGLSKKDAERIVVLGYFNSVINKMEIKDEEKEKLIKLIEEKINN